MDMDLDHTAPNLCPDWIFSNNSDAYVCKNREWFGECHPFRSAATAPFGTQLEILGIGTVDLPVKRSPENRVAYFKKDNNVFNVQLSEPPFGPEVGPSRLNPNNHYYLTVSWPPSECDRFEALRSEESHGRDVKPVKGPGPGYTTDKKKWLKHKYGGEFKFLQLYELSIYNEEDSEEGRAMACGLKAHDD
ncbi:hypothetical protein F5X99DRAFT_413012 [Biscogniauxia marginata]|nr:hypothetical protein F5X99DRAFT_413012 [Biscogniauxia marginata]